MLRSYHSIYNQFMRIDFLIIGQGLAGSLLAWELIRRDYRVIVIDSGEQNASLIAAGIINPVTGIRMALTPDVDTLLPAAQNYYSQLAEHFSQVFYHEMTMLRLFRNKAEQVQGNKRSRQKNYQPYLALSDKPLPLTPEIHAAMGWLEQKQTGYLSAAELLGHLKQFLVEKQAYRQEMLSYKAININQSITFQDINAQKLIFCEGHLSSQNPWFSWLPMQPVKGELLTIETEHNLPDAILNNGHWLLPLTQNTARTGATFDRETINNEPTEQGQQTLLMELKAMNGRLANATILSHQAGVRPCSADRFPFIGRHPQHDKILIFNGFGAKGSLQIPWYCQRFADYLQQQTPLPASCDINRYQNRCSTG